MSRSWHDFPFAPRRLPFFYGWVIIAASTVGILASMPGQTNGVSVFTDPLIEVLGLTRDQLSMAYMFGTIGASLMLSFAGVLIDRYGTRVTVVIASAGLGLSMLLFSQADRLTAFLGGSVPAALLVIGMCYLLSRLFGQGFLTMVSRVSLGKWFNHRRGLASAISGIFLTFGFNAAPALFNWLVVSEGWRQSCVILGATVGIGMSLFGWLFYRDNPEACGLVMDGVENPEWHARMERRVPPTLKEFTRGEACRTWAFWAFTLGVSSFALIVTGIVFHLSAIGETLGLTRDQSFALLLPIPFVSIAANFFFGWLSDHVRLNWILVVMMAFNVLSLYGLLLSGSLFGRILFAIGIGVSGGIFNVLLTTAFPRYFGRQHLGAISGRNMAAMVFASAVGPYLYSVFFKALGDFQLALWLSMVPPLIVLVGAFFVRNPQEAPEDRGG